MIIVESERKKKSDLIIGYLIINRKIKIAKIAKETNLNQQIIYNCISQFKRKHRAPRNRFLKYSYVALLEDKLKSFGYE